MLFLRSGRIAFLAALSLAPQFVSAGPDEGVDPLSQTGIAPPATELDVAVLSGPETARQISVSSPDLATAASPGETPPPSSPDFVIEFE